MIMFFLHEYLTDEDALGCGIKLCTSIYVLCLNEDVHSYLPTYLVVSYIVPSGQFTPLPHRALS